MLENEIYSQNNTLQTKITVPSSESYIFILIDYVHICSDVKAIVK